MNHRNHRLTEAQIAKGSNHQAVNDLVRLMEIRKSMRVSEISRRKQAIQETIDNLAKRHKGKR